ncbi:hypothetical protein KKA39_00165, partial [Patescibacteria group bacterium]|nr:hypothetical protein [Patescibacteria group bacterium]
MSKKTFLKLLTLFLVFSSLILVAEATTETFNSSTTWVAPAGVTSVTAEVWGAGGGGAGENANWDGGQSGGGGGAYSKKINIAVTPGNSYTVVVGTGGAGGVGGGTETGGTGGDSWFCNSTSNCATINGSAVQAGAKGGTGGSQNTNNGIGGASASGFGDTKYSGGNGGEGGASGTGSGGGGGAAGSTANGGNGGNGSAGPTGGVAGTGGATGGGNGGAGLGPEGNGNTGVAPGGGGSGASIQDNTNHNGGAGSAGRVVLTYTVVNSAPNAPTLVSPASGSTTSDNTPTLSANYSDPNTGDTGTTNYRIATSSANCLAGTVVASGTSTETSDNNEDTTWTPTSSIGSDATYYWCAQNNDGALTSAWTSMGNFILDTTTPSLVGCGSSVSVASGNMASVGIPSGIQNNDILITYVHQRDNINSSMSGWTNNVEGNGNATNRLEIFWKRTTGSETAPTVTHTGGSASVARMCAFRGATTTGDPFNVVGLVQSNSGSPISTASITTSVANTLILNVFGSSDDNTWGSYTGTPINEAAQNANNQSGSSDDSSGLTYGVKSVAGATGLAGATQIAKGPDAGVSVQMALMPPTPNSAPNAPTLVSPASGSTTSDNTPTLS